MKKQKEWARLQDGVVMLLLLKNAVLFFKKNNRPRQDSNLESPDS